MLSSPSEQGPDLSPAPSARSGPFAPEKQAVPRRAPSLDCPRYTGCGMPSRGRFGGYLRLHPSLWPGFVEAVHATGVEGDVDLIPK